MQDLRNGHADLFAVQRAFCDMILGEDDTAIKEVASPIPAKTDMFNWLGDNSRMLDPKEMNAIYHSSPHILQPTEMVEMAFKGRRDFFMFTTKRLISCDKKGIAGKSIEYLSIPWTSVVGFAVQSAGQILDLDSEMVIYTEIMYEPSQGEDDPPTPGMSMLEFGFNKAAVNILDIQKYLSARILGQERGIPIPPNMMAAAPSEGGLQSLLSRWGDDMKAIDSRELNTEFHTNAPILIDGEDLVMAFKAGRDFTLLTNKRILTIDTRGLTGKKRCYLSIPYCNVRAFGVESAGR
jgi:Bacterial PH domain